MRLSHSAVAGLAIGLLLIAAPVEAISVTGVTGGGLPQTTVQPSLGVNYLVQLTGSFDHLGTVMLFGGNFAPNGWAFGSGQILPIVQNPALFSILGTTYGGNGQTTFALPDLRGRVPIGQGTGPGLTPRTLGEMVGVEEVTLTTAQLASHNHTLPSLNTTSNTGGGQPYTNMQPSLVLNYAIALQGIFPSPNGQGGEGGAGDEPFIGQVVASARASAPPGWAFAQGQLLPIAQNQALFSLLGTTYGGNGQTTFALPDLRGRSPLHVGTGPGLTPHTLGEVSGVESVTLTTAQLPAHTHTLPPSSDLTGSTGGGQPQTNMQPTLALNFIIATEGFFPSPTIGTPGNDPYIGQINLLAGNVVPAGWALADGQILSIAQNTALFSLLGTTYGGNGQTTFALPDLRGRITVDDGQGPALSDWLLGQVTGVETLTLTEAQMAAHDHSYEEVPEPATMALVGTGLLVGIGVIRRRRMS